MKILRALGRFGLEVLGHILSAVIAVGVVFLCWWILDHYGISPVILL